MIGRLKEMFRSRDGSGWIVTFFTKEKIDGDRFDELAKYDCDIEIKTQSQADRPREFVFSSCAIRSAAARLTSSRI